MKTQFQYYAISYIFVIICSFFLFCVDVSHNSGTRPEITKCIKGYVVFDDIRDTTIGDKSLLLWVTYRFYDLKENLVQNDERAILYECKSAYEKIETGKKYEGTFYELYDPYYQRTEIRYDIPFLGDTCDP